MPVTHETLPRKVRTSEQTLTFRCGLRGCDGTITQLAVVCDEPEPLTVEHRIFFDGELRDVSRYTVYPDEVLKNRYMECDTCAFNQGS